MKDTSQVHHPSEETSGAKRIPPSKTSTEFKDEKMEQSIPECFENHARKYPDRIVFKAKKDALTWDSLNRAANRIARTILKMCETRERPIALLLGREASMMAASMGVLKAGGCYVPLAASHPRARTDYILNETEPSLIVTDNEGSSIATELGARNCRLINVDELDSSFSSENLGLSISTDSLASIAYTSGSTGEPKGVINTHRKLLYAIMHDKQFELGSDDRVTNVGSAERRNSFAFLLSGAASYPWYVKEEGLAHLADWLIREEITVYRSGPRVFRHFVSALAGKEQFPKLRVINLTGEPMHKRDVELYKKYFSSDCLLANTYGVSEIGPISMYMIGKETKIAGEIVPVGYQLPDREVLLLDDNDRQVDSNQVGEIAVRSGYLSLGYWRRPDTTEAKFLPDPDGGDRRICRTGDLGRMSPDGCLEHLGRKDFQVKIRGLRVEVTEVERALRALDSVREAVVLAREDHSGDKDLVAYIVPAPNASLSISDIRSGVENKVPSHMVPSRFVLLDALPLTPNGKVDRRALPDPGKSRPDLDTPFVASRTPVEKELSQIWAEVLSLEQIGVHDSFIELGGHSLLATQVVSRTLDKFRVEVSLQSLFESPTVAEMATVITRSQTKKAGEPELARMLDELEALSDEEAKQLLADEYEQRRTKGRHE